MAVIPILMMLLSMLVLLTLLIQVSGLHVNGPVFYDFKSLMGVTFPGLAPSIGIPDWRFITTQYGDDNAYLGASADVFDSGQLGLTSVKGGSAIMLTGEGFPASVPWLGVRLIYHLEVVPVAQNTGFVLIPGEAASAGGSRVNVETCLNVASMASEKLITATTNSTSSGSDSVSTLDTLYGYANSTMNFLNQNPAVAKAGYQAMSSLIGTVVNSRPDFATPMGSHLRV